ncbi:glycerophosphoryl diester phosphodiesterase membrane domain-containing protein [Calidifontibacter terrae]
MTNWGDPNGPSERAWTPPPGPPPPPSYTGYPPAGQQYPGQSPLGYVPLVPRPGVVPLRPLLFGDLLEGAFRTVRGNPGATLGLSLLVSCVAAVPLLLVTLLLGNIPLGNGDSSAVLFPLVSYGGSAITTVLTAILTGMLIVVVGEAVLGRRISISATWSRVKGRIWALLGVVLLIALSVVVFLTLLALLCWVAYLIAGVGLMVAAIILCVPLAVCAVVFVQVRTSLATPAVTLERMGPIVSLKRSWALTRNQFWRILGVTLVASLLAGIVGAIITVPASLVVAVAATGADGTASSSTGSVLPLLVLQAATLLASAITTPFTASVTGLLYIDQRIRREALDIRLMAEAAKG